MALLNHVETWLNAFTFVVYGAIWANWGANITVSDYKAGGTLWVPFLGALLAVAASLLLAISSPQREWLLAAFVRFLKELGALVSIANFVLPITRVTA
mgnify:CR=1 FL=1